MTDTIEDQIRQWLMDDGWSLRKDILPDIKWAYIAEDVMKRVLVVGQRAGKNDELLIQGTVVLAEDLSKKVDQLAQKERDEFLWDLRFELMAKDVEFEGVQLPLKTVFITSRVFLDSLNKSAFFDRISQVRKGMLVVQWMLARKLSQPLPQKQLGFHK